MIKAKIKEFIAKALKPGFDAVRERGLADMRSIVAAEVESALRKERRALHWIVRNEIQKSQHNIHFAELREASRSSYDYAKEHFGASKAFDDKFELRSFLFTNHEFIDGMFVEFGVYRGESIKQIAELFPGTLVHGFDSFEGLPEDWRYGFSEGHFETEAPVDLPGNVRLHKGWFSETLPAFLESQSEPVAMVHMDCDLYSSASVVFKFQEERLQPGTIILFDEYYNYPGWQNGEYLAFQEYLAGSGRSYEYLAHNVAQCQVAVRLQ